MIVKIAVNGGQPGAPATPTEIASDVAVCAAAGAALFHVHPRNAHGEESLFAGDVDQVMDAIRAKSPDVSIGLTTGAWILPDLANRLSAIAGWRQIPNFASVNFDEDGCELVARLLVNRGIGVEAGLLDAASTQRFLSSSIPVQRVLIEIQEQRMHEALVAIETIVDTLGDHPASRLLHGHGSVVWEMFDEAVRRGYDGRIGQEDGSKLPDGRTATNRELFEAAVARANGSFHR